MTQKTTGLARANSRSRGINFNTVSPSPKPAPQGGTPRQAPAEQFAPTTPTPCRAAPGSTSYDAVQSSLHYDFELPETATLQALALNEQLRLLALKEMSVVEIKDSIARLKALLAASESDIRCLQRCIQGSLHKQFKAPKPGGSGDAERAKRGPHRERPEPRPPQTPQTPQPPQPPRHAAGDTDRQSKIWSNLTKPISFISQLDTMISHEFEKSLGAGSPGSRDREIELKTFRHKDARSEQPDRHGQRRHQGQHHHHLQNQSSYPYLPADTDDMFQAVSSSLWSFVNDVKSNMIATLNDGSTLHPVAEGEPEKEAPSETFSELSFSSASESPEAPDLDMSLRSDSDDEDPVDLSIYSSMRRKPS